MLGVPTAMLRDSRNEYQPPDLWSIPAEYLTAAGLYSNAHVLKCYELGDAPATLAAANPEISGPAAATAPATPRRPPPSLKGAARAVVVARSKPPPLPTRPVNVAASSTHNPLSRDAFDVEVANTSSLARPPVPAA